MSFYLKNKVFGFGLESSSKSFLSRRIGIGGRGFIAGRVLEQGLPVVRRIMCYHRNSGELVSIVFSDNSGDYRFDNLKLNAKYYVLSLDENDDATQYNAVVQDMIVAL